MPQDIQSTLKDPEFLKLSPDDQVSVLKHMQGQTAVPKTPAVTELEKAAAPHTGTAAKLARGATLGAASGLGIPESTSGTDVVTGAIGNVGRGLYQAGKTLISLPERDPQGNLTTRGREAFVMGPAGPIVGDIARGVEGAGGEALKGIKERDPEQFAHGLGSLVTQILTLGEAGEGKPKAASITDRARLAKTSAALDISKGEIKDLKTAMPDIVKQAQSAGVNTVGEFGKNLKTARSLVDQEFNQGLAPIANKPTVPMGISQRIRNLITPDMSRTTEGRAQINYIKKRAVEYEKPWTFNELNAKRMTENDNLTSFYGKDTRGQAAAKLDTDISKAIRDGAADTVYQAWDQANPGKDSKALKQRQGALWALDDYVNSKDGFRAELEAKQLAHEGKGLGERVHARAAVHKGGISAYMTSSLLAPFERGPETAANAKIRKAFPSGSATLFKKTAINSLPISVLAGRQTPFEGPPPPPEPEE